MIDVILHDHVQLKPHVIIDGRTSIGAHTIISSFACIGGAPQDKKHHQAVDRRPRRLHAPNENHDEDDEDVKIGSHCVIRYIYIYIYIYMIVSVCVCARCMYNDIMYAKRARSERHEKFVNRKKVFFSKPRKNKYHIT
jgi:hypothetical protein